MTLHALRNAMVMVSAMILLAQTPSFAQPASPTLPDAVVTATSLSGQQQAAVEAYVAQRLADLQSEEPGVRERARDALLNPFTRSGVTASRAFRRAFDDAFEGALEGLITSPSVGVAICAAQIAGASASQSGYTALRTAMQDARPGVRYTAALQMGRLLAAADAGVAVVTGQQIEQGLASLVEMLTTEEDIYVVLGVTRGLSLPEGELRPRALTGICEGLSAQLQARRRAGALAAEEVSIFLTTLTSIRDATLRNAQLLPRQPEFAQAAAILAGQALGATIDLVERAGDEGLPQGVSRDDVEALATSAEVVASLAHGALRNENVEARIQQEVERALAGRSNNLRAAVDAWIGPNGRLTRQPYARDASDFR